MTLLTVIEVAEQLRLAPKTVRKLAREGKLTASKVAGKHRITPAAVEKFLNANRSNA